MKEQDILLRVQAFVDAELPEAEQAEIAALIARDPDVHALVKELKQTRQALAGFDAGRELPESREFYWSRIQREIERLPQETREPSRTPLATLVMRWLVPAACVAVVMVAGVLSLRHSSGIGDEVIWKAASADVTASTYRDESEGITLMWLSYSPDNTVANSGETANTQ